jgi:HTH-type transcriptional regulator/antitoxin HigA
MRQTAAAKRKLLTPPGDTIQETIDALGMSQSELAERLGKNLKNVNQIIKGKESISQNTAIRLERVLGIPASFWIERERAYRQEIAQIEALENLADDVQWAKEFPVKAMQDLDWIPAARDPIQVVKNLLTFFGIASKAQWKEIYLDRSISVAFRMSLAHTNNPEAVSAWLRQGELQAQKLKIKTYNKNRFVKTLEDARSLVRAQPQDFKEKLQSLCLEAGVALVFTPCLPRAPISGASRWVMNTSVPLIQLSCRYKTNDTFWFTFYHEAGHILKHGKKIVFLENVSGARLDKKKEKEVDKFASEALFPVKAYKKLQSELDLDESIIRDYAARYNTHPAIIAGRLEYDELVNHSQFRHLKVPITA